MKEKFDNFLKNGLTEYETQYLNDYKYVMMLCKDNNIKAYFANLNYMFFIEYPEDDKDYNDPKIVLVDEMKLANCEAGIIYENIDYKGAFQTIAFIDKTQNN